MRAERVVVTGASGFLGGAATERLAAGGFQVEPWCRDPAGFRAAEPGILPAQPFELEQPVDAGRLTGAAALVHAAHSFDGRGVEHAWRVNGEGSLALFRAARAAGVGQIVFVSSMAAHRRARSTYGRCKLRIESELEALGPAIVVRPGTIVGPGGIFARIAALARRLPVLPVIEPWLGPARRLQTVWIGDVAEALARILSLPPPAAAVAYDLADEDGVGIRRFHRLVARSVGRNPWLVPVPLELALPVTRAAEAFGISVPIGSDNLLGIRHLERFETRASWRGLGIEPRGLEESLERSARAHLRR